MDLTISKKMPVIFVGHGSPMNAIEDNDFTATWAELGKVLPKPKGILCISAHWYTKGVRITDSENPNMVYDMYGFPEALYEVKYPAPGAPDLAKKTKKRVELDGFSKVEIDNSWGLDHGAWSVLCKMYPAADIPVCQLSVDQTLDLKTHFEIGKSLKSLREEGFLILCSGNVVHNLSKVNWEMPSGYPWALTFDQYIKNAISEGNDTCVIDYKEAGACANLAFYSEDHFAPLLYSLGARDKGDKVTIFNEGCVLGSLSMTGYVFEA